MVIKLFSCCKLVKGPTRSVICDLQRGVFSFIPNSLFQILASSDFYVLEDIKRKFEKIDDQLIVDEYFRFLEEKEYIFFTDEPESFPSMSLDWDSPSAISNAIIEYNHELFDFYPTIINDLSSCGCKHIEYWIKSITIAQLKELLKFHQGATILSIDLHINMIDVMVDDDLLTCPRLNGIVFYGRDLYLTKVIYGINIIETTQKYDGAKSCGNINSLYFAVNIKLFTESQKYNSCLNRKISVDFLGNIKNCPAMNRSFGNVKDVSLISILGNDVYKSYWGIDKSKILVCMDCEFRYICTDCRAYLEDPDNSYSKPLKCGYDPYSGIWKKWSSDDSKMKAISFYEL